MILFCRQTTFEAGQESGFLVGTVFGFHFFGCFAAQLGVTDLERRGRSDMLRAQSGDLSKKSILRFGLTARGDVLFFDHKSRNRFPAPKAVGKTQRDGVTIHDTIRSEIALLRR